MAVKAIIIVGAIVIVVLSIIIVRFLCWNWCRENLCPNGCCVNDDDIDPVQIVWKDTPTKITPSVPPPAYNPDIVVEGQ